MHLRAGPLVRWRDGVSDVVQSACFEVLRDLEQHDYADEAHFKRWLYEAALRKIVDRNRYWRAQRRDPGREVAAPAADTAAPGPELFVTVLTPSQVVVGREEFERLERAFRSLSEEHREVIVQQRLLGRSHAEIAAEMGKSEVATRSLLARALARLSSLLGAEGGS